MNELKDGDLMVVVTLQLSPPLHIHTLSLFLALALALSIVLFPSLSVRTLARLCLKYGMRFNSVKESTEVLFL